jgi:hypothetical protein
MEQISLILRRRLFWLAYLSVKREFVNYIPYNQNEEDGGT